MTGGGFRRIGEQEVHQGYVWRVVTAAFEDPGGTVFERDIVRSPGAVGVVPLMFDAEGTPVVVLIRQWRAPYETELWEIPAGMRDVSGEPPELTASRELAEEAGYRAGSIEKLTELYPSPGLTDSVTHIYLATGLEPVDQQLHGPEEEHMTVCHMPLSEAMALVERGDIPDAKTAIGLLMTDRRLLRGDHHG
ncbi:MAG: NUDIX domain-containing protein [Acidimicrobiia bacterium]